MAESSRGGPVARFASGAGGQRGRLRIVGRSAAEQGGLEAPHYPRCVVAEKTLQLQLAKGIRQRLQLFLCAEQKAARPDIGEQLRGKADDELLLEEPRGDLPRHHVRSKSTSSERTWWREQSVRCGILLSGAQRSVGCRLSSLTPARK